MIQFLRRLWHTDTDPLVEGWYADQYPDLEVGGQRRQIREQYRARWPEPDRSPTPWTHPWLYDPCEPPQGWRYDPYYECWVYLGK